MSRDLELDEVHGCPPSTDDLASFPCGCSSRARARPGAPRSRWCRWPVQLVVEGSLGRPARRIPSSEGLKARLEELEIFLVTFIPAATQLNASGWRPRLQNPYS